MFKRYLSAELLRSRGSALQWLPLLAIPLVVMTVLFSSFASSAKDATGVLGWQSMFITGMYAPLIALFATIPEHREARTRSGGTLWRKVNPHYEQASRFLVILASLAAFHLLNFGVSWAVVALQGRANHQLLLVAGVYSFLGAIGIAGLAAASARRCGLAAALVAGIVWQVVSVLPSIVEGNAWWAFPPAWPLRLLLPALRIHQNSVPLDPGDPLLHESPLPAAVLCLLLAVVGACAAILTPRRIRPLSLLRRAEAPATTAAPTTAAGTWTPAVIPRAAARSRLLGAVRGLHRAALSPALIACLALTALALVFLSAIYPPSYVEGFFLFLLLPIGAGILPVMVWPLLAPSWPLSYIESRYSPIALLLWLLGTVVLVCSAASLAMVCSGGSATAAAAQLPLAVGVGFAITVVSLVIVLLLGILSALAFTIVGTIVSVTLGGDVLAKTFLWLLAFPVWPMNADSPGRYTVAALLTLLIAVAGSWASARLLRTTALRPKR